MVDEAKVKVLHAKTGELTLADDALDQNAICTETDDNTQFAATSSKADRKTPSPPCVNDL